MASFDPVSRKFAPLRDVYVAVVFLTRLPAPPWPEAASRPLGPAMWAFPLAGVLVATIGAIVYAVCDAFLWPVPVAALMAVAATILATGGLHEDGLADLADGAWGAATRPGRLEIMSDSRIGTFGTIALILSVAGRAAAIVELGAPGLVFGGMVAAAVVSRAMMPAMIAFGEPAKTDGLGAGAGKPEFTVWAGGLLLAAVIVILVAPGGWLTSMVGAAAGAALVGRFAVRSLGGYTGDTLGAAQQVAELFALAFIAAAAAGIY